MTTINGWGAFLIESFFFVFSWVQKHFYGWVGEDSTVMSSLFDDLPWGSFGLLSGGHSHVVVRLAEVSQNMKTYVCGIWRLCCVCSVSARRKESLSSVHHMYNCHGFKRKQKTKEYIKLFFSVQLFGKQRWQWSPFQGGGVHTGHWLKRLCSGILCEPFFRRYSTLGLMSIFSLRWSFLEFFLKCQLSCWYFSQE